MACQMVGRRNANICEALFHPRFFFFAPTPAEIMQIINSSPRKCTNVRTGKECHNILYSEFNVGVWKYEKYNVN